MSRITAWEILRSGSPAPLREVESFAAHNGLNAADRALVRHLVGTEVRRRGSLRAITKAFTRRPPKPELAAHLHLGIAQLLFLDRVPDHAAVSETCEAVARTVGASKVPFVNGLLRNVLRDRQEGDCEDPRRELVGTSVHLDSTVFRDPVKHPYLWAEDALSIPAAMMKRWARRLGWDPAVRLAKSFQVEPRLSLRTVGVTREAVREELAELDVTFEDGSHETSLLAPSAATAAITGSAAFREGRLTVHGESAYRAARLLDAQKGEEILDLCAAPGGKTAVLAEAGARVLACDIDSGRLGRVEEACARLGLAERVEVQQSDGTRGLAAERTFDAVLIDGPCSNTGVLGARPNARWRFGPASQASLREIQSRLLREGAERVRPGGRLVWSTCSLEPEENQQLVRLFQGERPEWKLADELSFVPDAQDGPHDGGYAALLTR